MPIDVLFLTAKLSHIRPRRTHLPGLLLLAALAVGIYARAYGLGRAPLAVDEYYFLTSIQRILDTGLPLLPAGGYYTRGILIQYVTAGFIAVTHQPELGLRLPSMLFGLATAILAFVYARRRIGTAYAALLACALLLSSWEIEFSRFGRMYAGLQFFTLAMFATLVHAFKQKDGWRRYIPHLAALAAVFSHSLGVFLLPLLFLPAFMTGSEGRSLAWPGRHELSYLLVTGAVALVALSLTFFDFRMLGVENALPEAMSRGGSFGPPDHSWPGIEAVTPYGVVLLGIVGLTALIWRRSEHPAVLVWASAFLAAAAFHQLLVAAAILLVLARRYRVYAVRRSPEFQVTLAGLVVATTWASVASVRIVLGSPAAWASGATSFPGAIRRYFFGWPDVYATVVRPFFDWAPLLTLAVVVATVFGLWRALRLEPRKLVRQPVVLFAYLVIAVGSFRGPEISTRYLYMAYPLALYVLVNAVRLAAGERVGSVRVRRAVVTSALGFLFLLGNDFHPRQIAGIASPDVSYRLGRWAVYQPYWYPRRDYRSPATYVTRYAASSDAVVAANVPPASYYLRRDHIVYLPREGRRFPQVSRRRGTIDLWSGQRLASTPAELRELTRENRRVWLIEFLPNAALDPEVVWSDRLVYVAKRFISKDRRLAVYEVLLAPQPTFRDSVTTNAAALGDVAGLSVYPQTGGF